MRHSIAVVVAAMLLSACAAGSPAASEAPTAPLIAIATAPAAPQLAPDRVAPADAPAAATAVEGATPAGELPSALPGTARNGYATLVALKGITLAIEQIANQDQSSSTAESLGVALGRRLVVAAAFKAVEGSLAAEPPDPALAGAWAQARVAAPKLKSVIDQWAAQQLATKDLPAALAPFQGQIDQALASGGQDLSGTYGLDAAQLKSLEDAALAQLPAALQPAP